MFVATQDFGLMRHFKSIAGAPVIYFNLNQLILDKFSKETLKMIENVIFFIE